MASRPFEQLPFDQLPLEPRKPHVFDDTRSETLSLTESTLGPMSVHVRVYGEGPPLLLVHGLMTSSYSWRYAMADLGRHFTCYAPDLPGAGRTEAPAFRHRFCPEALAGWLSQVQAHLGIKPCPVIGNSMGGYLCMHWALQEPGAMTRLLNLHSPGVPDARLAALGMALRLPGARSLLRRLVHRDSLRWAHRNVHYYDESLKSLEEAEEYGRPLATRAGTDAFYRYLRDTMDVRPMVRFQRRLLRRRRRGEVFPLPLLLLYASADPMVPPRVGARLAKRIPSAQLMWLKEGSHFAHVDAVGAFLEHALRFLEVTP